MKKILVIDPWGVGNTAEYLNGLLKGLSYENDVTLVTNHYFENKFFSDYLRIKRIFFKLSEHMHDGTLRKIIRGFEYIWAYIQILTILKKEKFDVVHINWLLMYRLDAFFLKRIKGKGTLLVYTAHNVLPHIKAENSIEELRKIYSIVDRIVIHGQNLYTEFNSIFPQESHKLYVQKHGANFSVNTSFNKDGIPSYIKSFITKGSRVFLYIGIIFYDKGVDRLFNIWRNMPDDQLLIVAGKNREQKYSEFKNGFENVKSNNNVLFINEFVSENLHNYLCHSCNVILLPYRHASMSGVVFTAADFEKAVMCTNVGALPEYIENGISGFIVDNDDLSIEKMVKYISSMGDKELVDMGDALSERIHKECDWMNISSQLIRECYKI